MITVIEQNITDDCFKNFEKRNEFSQRARLVKFRCSWEQYIDSYIKEKPLFGKGESELSGYSFTPKQKVIDLKYDGKTLSCILDDGIVKIYRFTTRVNAGF